MWVEGQGGIQSNQYMGFRYDLDGKEYYNYLHYRSSKGEEKVALFLFTHPVAQNEFLRANYLVPNIKEYGWNTSSYTNDPLKTGVQQTISFTTPVGNTSTQIAFPNSGGLVFDEANFPFLLVRRHHASLPSQ